MIEEYQQSSLQDLLDLAASSNDAMRELIHRHTRLVRACARPLFLAGADHEDLVQEGMIGLVEAIRLYDPGSGTSFQSFAALCIRRQMVSAVRAASAQKHAPLNESVSFEVVLSREYPFSGADPESELIVREGLRELMDALRTVLTNTEKAVLEFFLDGLSYQEIAERIGKPRKSVDNAVQRIRRKATYILGESGFPV